MSKRRQSAPVLNRMQKWGPIALGLLFLVAGTSKVVDPGSFHATLPDYGITGIFRTLVAVIVPALEVVLGAALVMRWRIRQTSLVAGLFLAAFILLIGFGWWRGSLEECGCFGAMLERSPGEAIAIDLLFLGLAAWAWRVSADAGRSRKDMAGIKKAVLIGAGGGALVLTISLLLAGPTGLQAMKETELHPEMQSVDLEQGEHLVYLFHHECPQCAKMSPLVAEYARGAAFPHVLGYTMQTTREDIDTYRDRHGLRIPVQSLPSTQFGRITGDPSVPQLLLVRDGEIAQTWSIVFPDVKELRDLLDNDTQG